MKIVMAIIKPFKLEEVRDAVASDQVDKTIDAITSAAKTGQIGDGKIFVINLDHAVRIRTGEADAAAL
jgi:nitrogen regulatory protein P-II 2